MAAGKGLAVRSGPGAKFAVQGKVLTGTVVRVQCKAKGQPVDGNAIWYTLADKPRLDRRRLHPERQQGSVLQVPVTT
ncbi:hypothetical protein ACWGIU_27165 [Streptomyces sp. NPDC054840]